MAFLKPLNLLWFDLVDTFDVQTAGLVLTLVNVGGVPKVRAVDVDAATPEPVFGVAYMTSEDPLYSPHTTGHTTQYLTGVEIALIREGVVNVPYHQDLAFGGITVGNLVSTLNQNAAYNGYVRNHNPTALPNAWNDDTVDGILEEPNQIVGIALESKAANTTGMLKVLLQIRNIQYAHT